MLTQEACTPEYKPCCFDTEQIIWTKCDYRILFLPVSDKFGSCFKVSYDEVHLHYKKYLGTVSVLGIQFNEEKHGPHSRGSLPPLNPI